MGKTSIEWTDFSISPIRARDKVSGKVFHFCEKISPGCAHCYAATMAQRFGLPDYVKANREKVEFFLDESKLLSVLKRKKPTRFFWEDCSDLFGDWVSDEWLDRCFATMALAPQHTHQVLTKRPERMREYLVGCVVDGKLKPALREASLAVQDHEVEADIGGGLGFSRVVATFKGWPWPLPNVWLGVSVEDQQRADERIPPLLQTLAAVRFLSVEPLLGPVDLQRIPHWKPERFMDVLAGDYGNGKGEVYTPCPRVNWVIIGGESGTGAHPCRLEWLRSLVRQCQAAAVPLFVKQLGSNFHSDGEEWPSAPRHILTSYRNGLLQNTIELSRCKNGRWNLRDRKGGWMEEWPEDLRVREFPKEEKEA